MDVLMSGSLEACVISLRDRKLTWHGNIWKPSYFERGWQRTKLEKKNTHTMLLQQREELPKNVHIYLYICMLRKRSRTLHYLLHLLRMEIQQSWKEIQNISHQQYILSTRKNKASCSPIRVICRVQGELLSLIYVCPGETRTMALLSSREYYANLTILL